MLLFNPIKPEILEIPEGGQMKQNHGEQHLAKRELTLATTLAPRRDQTMPPPIFKGMKGMGKIIKTTKKG